MDCKEIKRNSVTRSLHNKITQINSINAVIWKEGNWNILNDQSKMHQGTLVRKVIELTKKGGKSRISGKEGWRCLESQRSPTVNSRAPD